jgi:hypothetical protein
MGRHCLVAQPFTQMAGDPFGEAAGVHEDDGGLVGLDELGDPVVHLAPHVSRHDRLERRLGQLQCEVEGAAMASVDDLGGQAESRMGRPRPTITLWYISRTGVQSREFV